MPEHSPESTVGKYFGPPINTALGVVVTWATAGSIGAISPALVALLSVLGGICGLALTLVYRRYLGVLGANRKVPAERRAYDALRRNLVGGNLATRLYARWLTTFLDGIDRFFGDAGKADQTLFWLKTPAPLWTAPAFELCLLLALIYPIATIFIVWAVSGHVGPAENALHLNPRLIAWQRWLVAAVFGFSAFAVWRAARETRWKKRLIFSVVCIAAFVIAVALSVAQAGAIVVGSAHANLVMMPTSPPLVSIIVAFLGAVSVATTIAVISAGLGALRRLGHRWEGAFLWLFVPGMILACCGAATWLSPLRIWQMLGPLLLFLGLLTLLNAPFDWFSVGLTRALLRLGLQLGSWWPYVLAIVDAALAAVIVGVLALVMVIGIQTFDSFALHGGGKPVLPLEPMFKGIAEHPTAPEYWWIYALLLSTMIPSLVNLAIGGTSLARDVPGLPNLILRSMPAQGAVLRWDRAWIATLLTGQIAIGTALGIAAQILLAVGIIGYVMPWLGLGLLLDMARDIAAFDLPARVWELFGGAR
jgi:hypothetical protein